MNPMNLFGLPDHLRRLSATGDPRRGALERVVDFEGFQASAGGGTELFGPCTRMSYDPVVMFKVLILAALSGVRVGGVNPGSQHDLGLPRAADGKPVRWRICWRPSSGCWTRRATGGQVVDSTLVSVPRQRIDSQEREVIWDGRRASEDLAGSTGESSTEGYRCMLDGQDQSGRKSPDQTAR